jgi:phosphoribosylformylglycinamidine synthase PurS subunit
MIYPTGKLISLACPQLQRESFYVIILGETMAIVVVDVALKPEILDPQGRAIVGALGRVGLSGVADVRQGKQFVLNIDGEIDDAKLAQINEIASTLLSNPVIEDFTVQVRP